MSLEITYYAGGQNPNVYGPPINSETRVASGTSAASGLIPANAVYVRIHSTANNRYALGATPVATATAGASGHYIASGADIDLQGFNPGVDKIAVITAS